jgi:hypothetical protein
MCISGLALGCMKGWGLTLCLLGLLPPIGLVTMVMVNITSSSLVATNKAYAQSAGYAD